MAEQIKPRREELGAVGPAGPAGAPGTADFFKKHINGFQLSWFSDTQVKVTDGECRDQADSFDMTSTVASLIDVTLPAGAGSVDVGVVAIALYNVFLIEDPNPLAAIASLAHPLAGPLLPAGYTKFRYVGSFKVKGIVPVKIVRFVSEGNANHRVMHFTPENGFEVDSAIILSGSALFATPIFTSSFTSPLTRSIVLRYFLFRTIAASDELTLYLNPISAAFESARSGVYNEYVWPITFTKSGLSDSIPIGDSLGVEYKVGAETTRVNLYISNYVYEV